MSKGNTVKYDLDPKRAKGMSEETKKRLDALTDEEIEAVITQDPDSAALSEDDFEHEGRSHHFISQAEQRFNAREDDKNKIYKFEVIEHGPPLTKCPPVIRRTNDRGVSIRSNLAFKDLFAFDRSGATGRNFERLFAAYENDLHQAVSEFIVQVETHDAESLGQTLLKILVLKILSFFRNPFSIEKALNSFPSIEKYEPTERYFLHLYREIDALQDQDIPEKLRATGLSLEMHKKWLKSLFLMLLPSGDRNLKAEEGSYVSIMEAVVFKLLTNPENLRVIWIDTLSEDFPGRFLLNDRSFFSATAHPGREVDFNFNITDRIALRLQIRDMDTSIIQEVQKEFTSSVQVIRTHNDQQQLQWFNEMMILQAHKYVYCSQKDVYGIKVLGPRTKQHTKR